ncbi:hypothetical protein ES708_28185 [subsurface metagenome]
MTPAEKPRDMERNFILVVLAKKAIALPIPVDNPANRVNPKAKNIVLVSIISIHLNSLAMFMLLSRKSF